MDDIVAWFNRATGNGGLQPAIDAVTGSIVDDIQDVKKPEIEKIEGNGVEGEHKLPIKKLIFKKGSNRINTLRQSELRLSRQVSNDMPSIEELKNINDYIFRIDENTPKLREAVQTQLEKLKGKYPELNFSAEYGVGN